MNDEAEMILRGRVKRGADAKLLLEHPLLVAALNGMEDEIMSKARSADPQDRDVFWRELGALSSFRKRLEYYISAGGQAEKTLMQRIKDNSKKLINR